MPLCIWVSTKKNVFPPNPTEIIGFISYSIHSSLLMCLRDILKLRIAQFSNRGKCLNLIRLKYEDENAKKLFLIISTQAQIYIHIWSL